MPNRRSVTLALRLSLAVALAGVNAVASARPSIPLPPPVPDRVGVAQIFDYKVANADRMAGHVDFVWGTRFPATPGVYAAAYVPAYRDFHSGRDLAWFRQNHPDWIVQRCDRAGPAWEFEDHVPVPIDVGNPEARRYFFQSVMDGELRKLGSAAVAVDNLELDNSFNRCPTSARGAFSGKRQDSAYAAAAVQWIDTLAAEIHGRGRAFAANLYYAGRNRAQFLAAARNIDILLDEHGFVRKCKPMVTGEAWVDRVTLYRQIARTHAVVTVDQLCAREADITPAVRDWSLASYLMYKGDRSYLAQVAEQNGYGRLIDTAPYAIRTGLPLADGQAEGALWVRRFERVVAVVNPSSDPATFAAGKGWRRRDGSAVAGSIVLAPGTAIVLVRYAQA